MVPITALWLPILLSAVIVFVASSILHMVLPIHKRRVAQVTAGAPHERFLLVWDSDIADKLPLV